MVTPVTADARADACVESAERHLHRGDPLLAYNDAQAGLAAHPGHVRLRQLQALALARSADVEGANRLFAELAAEGRTDSETLGMLARTHKDLGLAAADVAQRAHHLGESLRIYAGAFDAARREGTAAEAGYTGINAAALAVLTGDLPRASTLAAEVRRLLSGISDVGVDEDVEPATASDSSRYWHEATLGEAALILGDDAEARRHYARAAAIAGRRWGDLNTTRRQALLLAAHLPGDRAAFADALRVPPVLVFTGNMVDAPGRTEPRFPASTEASVRAALSERIAQLAPMAVYASAACGADILCLELVRAAGGETHVVLPFPPEEFRPSSVDFAGGDWGERFERALAAADSVTIASDHRASGSAAPFHYANLILTGMGRLRAGVLDARLAALAVLDSAQAGFEGGAASLVAQWRRTRLEVECIEIGDDSRAAAEAVDRQGGPAEVARGVGAGTRQVQHELRTLLFADAVGYSQLSEDQIPGFIDGFLESVASLNRRTAHRFEHVETSGDGLYMVFRNVEDAGRYALELSAVIRDLDRAAWTLPAGFDLRIALHCGPVHCARDPVTGGNLYTGPHTSRAARIEPVTPPGQVYASSAFAAVAAASGAHGMSLRYVGRIALAKGYGLVGLYSLRPAAP